LYQEECKLLLINCAKRRENVTEIVAIVEKIVKNRKVEHMEQKNAWNSGTCGTVECEEKENQCGFHEKQGAYCTKKTKMKL
jgi:hypothetical protein